MDIDQTWPLVVTRPGTDSGLLFHFSHCRGIGDFMRFISIFHTVASRFFYDFGEMNCADKRMNPIHYGRNVADIQISIRINPEIRLSWQSLRLFECCCFYVVHRTKLLQTEESVFWTHAVFFSLRINFTISNQVGLWALTTTRRSSAVAPSGRIVRALGSPFFGRGPL